mgnify:CR=1 FL=1
MDAKPVYLKCLPVGGRYSTVLQVIDVTWDYGTQLNWTNCIVLRLAPGETVESKGYSLGRGGELFKATIEGAA